MKVVLNEPDDLQRLKELSAGEKNALQRDRYRAVLLAVDDREGDEIARHIGRSPRFVDQWLARYRRQGLAGLIPKKQPGARPKLTPELEARLRERLDAGATPADGVCTLRGKDIVRILDQEMGVKHTLGSIYGVLDRLGYSCLSPRPRHEKNDPKAIEEFKEQSPLLSRP
jgi:putative transposase